MRKVLFGLLGLGWLCLMLLTGWALARLTGAIQYYTTPSASNYPTFHLGDTFFTSNLVKPARLDFIAYRHSDPGYGTSIYCHRVCGLPGDTLEIRRGTLYVNGQNLDKGLSLMSHYTLAAHDLASLPGAVVADTMGTVQPMPLDSVSRVGLADADVARYRLPAHRLVLVAGQPDYAIRQLYQQPWNQDNFGPLVIPAGRYFVLGDNRHNAADSRYNGTVAQESVAGTVLGKH